jgi:hypothetical protein
MLGITITSAIGSVGVSIGGLLRKMEQNVLYQYLQIFNNLQFPQKIIHHVRNLWHHSVDSKSNNILNSYKQISLQI